MAITLTEPAIKQVKSIVEAQGLEQASHLRMAISGGGCSGMQYSLGFDTEFDPETDAAFDNDGLKIVTRKKFAIYLDGTTIDFLDGPMGTGFKIENPNQPPGGGCAGCGGGHY